MRIKTIQRHLENLSKARIAKQDINAISKFLGSLRYGNTTNSDKTAAQFMLDLIEEKDGGYRLTKEQTEFGIQWLRDRYIKKDGRMRKALEKDFMSYEHDIVMDIIRNFKEFRFIGYYAEWNSFFKEYCHFVPVYRVHGKNGDSFDYSPVYMGEPIINPEPVYCLEA
jgi:hypothetical protein